MASETDHIAIANRNQKTLSFLCSDPQKHGPWIAAIAFYKALHIIEAVFVNDNSIGNTHDHKTREQRLKTTRRYSHINQHYQPLQRASTIARYMPCNTFWNHIESEKIIPVLLAHHLHQIEASAVKFLTKPDMLTLATAGG